MTPRLLLCHAGGTTVHGFPGYEPTATLPSVPDILDGTGGANTAAVRVDLEPGTKERYSGGGTTILQLLLTEVTGKPFPQVLEEWVLAPAGMTDSAFDQPPATRAREVVRRARTSRRARRHRRDGTSIRSSPPPGCGPRRATSRCSRSRCGGRGAATAIAC